MGEHTKCYMLNGLCCASCADKIGREVRALEGVDLAEVDLVSGTLTVELTGPEAGEELLEKASEIAGRHDPDIEVRELVKPSKGESFLFMRSEPEDGGALAELALRVEGVFKAEYDGERNCLVIAADDSLKLPQTMRKVRQALGEAYPQLELSYKEIESISDKARLRSRLRLAALIAGGLLFAAGLVLNLSPRAELALFCLSYLLVGGEIVLKALSNLLRGAIFDENFLMSLASIGAFAIGDHSEAVAVMLFYRVGEACQDMAVDRSRRSISALVDVRPDYANLITEDGEQRVFPEEVGVGERVLVRPGEKIPLDGLVLSGSALLDVSALSGESLPLDVTAGDEVLSGSINKNGLLTIEAGKPSAESTVSKILELVENAGAKKARTEDFITRFARVYTPVVVAIALLLLLIPTLLFGVGAFYIWLRRALIFLVVSCPCALVISIPLSFFGGIGGASRNGILIKGSNYLETVARADTFVFDKTGTLTKGSFALTEVLPAGDIGEKELLRLAASLESFSNHPIAASIVSAYGAEPDKSSVSEFEELPGMGIKAVISGETAAAGNARLMRSLGVEFKESEAPGSAVYIARGGSFAGTIVVSDRLKADSRQSIADLRALGVKRTVMLSGDKPAAAAAVAGELNIDSFHGGLLPQQKVERLEQLRGEGKALVFVGDGINDAPVLAYADVGIAMGASGSDAAIEAAEIVLLGDELTQLVKLVKIARKTRAIVLQNISFVLLVKGAFLILSALGLATMWQAVFADVGVALIAILNAMRAMRKIK